MVKRPMLQQALHLGRFSFWRLLLTCLTTALLLGCGAELRERTVSDVRVVETAPSEVDLDDLLQGLVTAEPRTLLFVERERDVYDANLVARDLERIERFYRAQGYYDVKVVAARVESVGERKVAIEVHVSPGPRVKVRSVLQDQQALLNLPFDVQLKYKRVPPPATGKPFTEARLDRYQTALLDMLKQAGFAYAKVKVTATVDLNAGAADVVTQMQPGKRARFGPIRISGLRQIPESKVRAALDIKSGDQYSDAEQADARDALSDMQLFTRVEVTPDLSNPDAEEVPILVTVQEDQLRKLQLGGGVVIDALKLEWHLTSGWEHKNFLGGARKLSIQATGGVDLYPTRLENFDTLSRVTNVFPMAQTSATLEQPALFGGRTRGSVQAAYSLRPLLYTLAEDSDPNKEPVLGYHEPRGQLALERNFVGKRIYLKTSYNVVARVPHWYQNEACTPRSDGTCNKGAGLQTVFVSYPRVETVFQTLTGDIFDDRAKRELVFSFRNTLEVAGMKIGNTRLLGGSLSDIKIEPELRGLLPIFARRRNPEQRSGNLVLAGRLKFGFLLAADYGRSLRTDLPANASAEQTDERNVDQQKLLTRALYSGGSTSNRGYAYNAISPYGPIGFLAPATVNCGPGSPDAATDKCLRPLGGFTEWEASLELRYAGFYPLSLAFFADASDVSRNVGTLGFNYPHLSVGPGVRYETPVGPLRLDLGIRVPGAQAWGQPGLPRDFSHGRERPELFGLPGAIQLAIGDAF